VTHDQALRALEEILLPHGGTGLYSELNSSFTDDRVIEHLRQYGEEFSKTGLVVHKLANQNCHSNVSDFTLIKLPGYQIAHGFALGTDGLWYLHSWGVQNGHIVETCPREGHGRMKYFGFKFPTGVNVNATHGGLGDELQRSQASTA